MNLLKTRLGFALIGSVLLAPASVLAQDFYIGGSIGNASPDDLTNNGQFATPFTTGEVTGVSPPLTLSSGTPVSWNTSLDSDTIITINAGMKMGSVRYEVEYSQVDYDISGHSNVNAGGIGLDAVDVGVLLTGQVGDVGVTTGDFVAAATGSVDTSALFLNAYYDFDLGNDFMPYVGGGIGMMDTDIDYSPSDTQIINDSDDVFVYQIVLGVSYLLNEQVTLFADYRYREADDADVDASLIPASFDIENNQSDTFNLGVRYSF